MSFSYLMLNGRPSIYNRDDDVVSDIFQIVFKLSIWALLYIGFLHS